MSGRTLILGDIHGNLSAFQQCLQRAGFDKTNDRLIQLGDVSDRHLFTAEVTQELIGIPNKVILRGNHDVWTRDWLLHGKTELTWLQNGGYATITSYERATNAIDIEAHKGFYEHTQINYYIDPMNRLFVHGGFTHPKGPAYEEDETICLWDRSLWRNALESKSKGPLLDAFHEIYVGHTPTLNWYVDTPMNVHNIWNLDTGAGTTGKLTIMDVNTKEYWQSD